MSTYFVTDLETGGLDEEQHQITEIGIIVLEGRLLKQVDYYQSYVKPYNNLKITDAALQKSQISIKDIENGSDHRTVMQEVVALSKKYGKRYEKPIFVGHNFSFFDRKFLEYLFRFLNKNLYDYFENYIIDTMYEMKRYEGGDKNNDKNKYKLAMCCERLGVILKSAHGAEADILATSEVFRILTDKMRSNGNDGNLKKDNTGTKKQKARHTFEI